jgi:hypothetical protein
VSGNGVRNPCHATHIGMTRLHRDRGPGESRYADWRRDTLVRAGFEPGLSAAVAGDPRIDVHEMLELVDRGCPPDLAVRILAPLEPAGDWR